LVFLDLDSTDPLAPQLDALRSSRGRSAMHEEMSAKIKQSLSFSDHRH